VQRLEDANAELQDRLVATGAAHADLQAQAAALDAAVRGLEAAKRELEGQLLDLREKLRASEPALDAALRQAEARGAEARRAADAVAEAERVRGLLEAEVAGLKSAAAELRKEVETGERGLILRGGRQALRESDLKQRLWPNPRAAPVGGGSATPAAGADAPFKTRPAGAGAAGRRQLTAGRCRTRTPRGAQSWRRRRCVASCRARRRRWSGRGWRATSCGSG
jgi:hypothetical protein